ncbi:MAG: glycosyltransferase family 4 protein [Cyclobacteriaceae bacterium]
MPESSQYESVYIAFDPYPSFKGSATHIKEVYDTLCNSAGRSLLVTLEGTSESVQDHRQLSPGEGNYLQRGIAFSKAVGDIIDSANTLQFVQYRDIWGGLPTLNRKDIVSIFEVNGFPSIELRERYPILPKSTIAKIRQLEKSCLHSASEIICPSRVIADNLLSRGIRPQKITVIPNGTHLPSETSEVNGLPEEYLVYFGALQPWQGLHVAIKAFKYLADLPDIKLVICSSHKEKLSRPLKKFIANCGYEDRIVWKYQLSKPELHQVISKALISLAPLSECERNLTQGCSPLKIYETMACKTALIASDIPVVREIVTHDTDAFLVKPDRPADLARGIRLLSDDADKRKKLAENAYRKVLNQHTWQLSNDLLADIYQKYLITEPT